MTKDRRKAIPDRVKLIVTLRELGLTVDQVNYDHHPALELREWDEKSGDYNPPQLDPERIQMLLVGHHQDKTFGNKATSADGDLHKIAKAKRIAKNPSGGDVFVSQLQRRKLYEDNFVEAIKSPWPKRPFLKKEKRKYVSRKNPPPEGT